MLSMFVLFLNCFLDLISLNDDQLMSWLRVVLCIFWYVEKFYSISEMVKLNNENDSICSLAELLNKQFKIIPLLRTYNTRKRNNASTFLTFYTRFILFLAFYTFTLHPSHFPKLFLHIFS